MAYINHTNVKTALRLANHWCGHIRKVMDGLKGLSGKRGAIFVLPLINNLIKPHQMEKDSIFFTNLKKLICNGDLYISFKRHSSYLNFYLNLIQSENKSFFIKTLYYLDKLLWNDIVIFIFAIVFSVSFKWYSFVVIWMVYFLINEFIFNVIGRGLITSKVLSSEDWFDDLYESEIISIGYTKY